ncbi:MAG: UTP--glucose-1-phosphate uridylyltransferase [Sphingomonadaceae bacterium]|uniref:UTP--glucose-1-phosphate uridylyltransferase n=1 Tax=Thermaurantiacus sp. TaxID=2820283 RepID=UPI00298F325C|nr:UTP--glucose-1-phosphate uridylyltransferase [Thermaurantiacus sp.]MCS6986968.1 UTP--glucose-1-phosphate uridylyltransferase [Sphingomonadaceae bacterium]MDW8415432.1 UTP--glucose-1-phosphate uridylyltransferase [Thermaurantiacus sp.]
MNSVEIAVLPVGGLGTRFLPATKSVAKELLPVVDRPLLQYAVDEARAAGIRQFVLVTARGKASLADYFDVPGELIRVLEERGKSAELEILRATQLDPGAVITTRQQQPLGLGHAVWCARHVVGRRPFAVLLPDELLWNPSRPCLVQMVEAWRTTGGNMVAVMEVPLEHVNRYGIVDPGRAVGLLTEVRGLVEKPAVDQAPSRLAVVGRYILQPEVMDVLAQGRRGAGGEVQLTDAMAELIGRQPFHALRFLGERFDCGDKAGHVIANVALALERPDIGPAVRAWLAQRLGVPG